MDTEKSLTLVNRLPEKWKPKYQLKRIDEEPITITLETRNKILLLMDKSVKYIQIGEHTIMLNSIKGIEPLWGEKNIPPRPVEEFKYEQGENKMLQVLTNKKELDEWDKYFKQ